MGGISGDTLALMVYGAVLFLFGVWIGWEWGMRRSVIARPARRRRNGRRALRS